MSHKHWRPAAMAARLADARVVVVSLVITAVVSALLGISLSLADADPMQLLESQMAFGVQRFIDAIGPLGPDGIAELMRTTITLDFVYPIAYATAVGAVWARVTLPTAWSGNAFPLAAAGLAAAADWLENLFHLAASAQMVDGARPFLLLVLPGSVAAAAKWALILTALLLIARSALRRRGRVALTAIPIALLAGALAAVVVAATI